MEQGMADLFDHIDDLLDFPSDDDQDYDGEDALVMVQQPCNNTGAFLLPPLGLPPPPPPAAPIAVDGALAGAGDGSLECSSNQKPRDEFEIAELEWTTAFLDGSDPFCHDLACYDVTADTDANGDNAQSKGEIHAFFRTASPVSVLGSKPKSCSAGADSSSSSSSSTCASYLSGGENEGGVPFPPTARTKGPLAPLIPARARSKRRRPAGLLARAPVVTPSVPPSSDSIAATSDPESSGESCPPRPTPPPPPKKIKITFKKRSPVAAAAADEEDEWGSNSPAAARKCLHCGIQKTPQWRAGPLGPKTLCNACGVRYKSGRLFPEYRPAASPTFVPTLHSNSHKKVVEMRIQTTKQAAAPASDGCDLLEYIRRRH